MCTSRQTRHMNKSKGDCMVDYMNVRPSTVGDLHGPCMGQPPK